MSGISIAPHPSQAIYFFLSYAEVGTDPEVTEFFHDLSRAVRRHARRESRIGDGLYNRSAAFGEKGKSAVASALSAAEVLVPLYSPRYIRWITTTSEYDSFRQRVAGARGHVQPVHWVPLAFGDPVPDGIDLTDIAADIPVYVEEGLHRMMRQDRHRTAYQAIVDRLAQRIVTVAEKSPVGPSPAPPLPRAGVTAPNKAQFLVAVLAPTRDRLPPGRRADTYDSDSSGWQPFVGGHVPPVAQQVADVAERHGLTSAIVDATDLAIRPASRPTMLLIDPWIIEAPGGRGQLESLVGVLPEWVSPTVIVDPTDPQSAGRGAELATTVDDILRKASGVPASTHVNDASDFDQDLLAGVVHKTRRRYLRRMPVRYPARQSLTGPYVEAPIDQETPNDDD